MPVREAAAEASPARGNHDWQGAARAQEVVTPAPLRHLGPPQQVVPTRSKAKVLLVDDEEDILASMREVVHVLLPGLRVVVARSGTEALAALAANAGIRAVVADYRMPQMDGLQLAQAIHRAQPRLAVVIVSAFADDGMRESAKVRGAFSFLPKPFAAAELAAVVVAAISASGPSTSMASPAGHPGP